MTAMRIDIDLCRQTLRYGGRVYAVSSAAKGGGEINGSNQTPRGLHIIKAKVGAKMPVNTVFRGRRPTGEIYRPALAQAAPRRDWILTRILWLGGMEAGKNRYGKVDTLRRYIYIHGAPDDVLMGEPGSIGCIRMHNADVMALFDAAPAGTLVMIRG
ncbi:MAG: L,D-transpeptidase family protein [Gammaproteobacteria bacterium]